MQNQDYASGNFSLSAAEELHLSILLQALPCAFAPAHACVAKACSLCCILACTRLHMLFSSDLSRVDLLLASRYQCDTMQGITLVLVKSNLFVVLLQLCT